MSRPFHFKQFSIYQEHTAMKVGTDGVLLGCFVNELNPEYALDIGTGTGLLVLMLAQKFHMLQLDALEIDEAACTEAAHNIKGSPWAGNIRLFQESLQEYAVRAEKKYDLIICNPPYFKAANESKGNNLQKPSLSRARARFADHLPFTELVEGVNVLLREDGYFYIVLPTQSVVEVENLLLGKGFFLSRKMEITGKEGAMPNRLLMRWGRKQEDVQTTSLTMYSADANPREEYIEFTKDFYLWKKYGGHEDLKW